MIAFGGQSLLSLAVATGREQRCRQQRDQRNDRIEAGPAALSGCRRLGFGERLGFTALAARIAHGSISPPTERALVGRIPEWVALS